MWPAHFKYADRAGICNSRGQGVVGKMMEEVHANIPSTVKRVKKFGPGGKEAMLRAIAFSKARKAGARA